MLVLIWVQRFISRQQVSTSKERVKVPLHFQILSLPSETKSGLIFHVYHIGLDKQQILA